MRNLKKQIIAGLMAALMLTGMSSAMAAEVTTDGGTGETTVTLTADAATFNVTVPTSIVIHINADGTVTCPTDVAITNQSSAPVKVTNVAMENRDWTLVSYDTDMFAELVGTKKLALKLTNVNSVVTTNAAGATQDLGNPQWGSIAAKTGSFPIEVSAKAPAAASSINTAETAAAVIFTVGWAA